MVSSRARAAADGTADLLAFFASSAAAEAADPDACVFTFGNPHEMPLPGLVGALQTCAEPHDPGWFAYKASEPEPSAFLADSLSRELGLSFEPQDVLLTAGAFAAITVAFHLLTDPGDEVVIQVPGWFLYAPILAEAGVTPVEAPLAEDGSLDLGAIEAAISPRTRVVVVNSPHNPTGKVYGAEELAALGAMLERASARVGHRIYLLSDEPYRRIRFGTPFTSPAAHYPHTLIDYSYGKVLLAPGQRLGYLALGPLMPADERAALAGHAFATAVALGWVFPSALMQHAVPDLEHLSIDLDELAAKRDLLVGALRDAGYRVLEPEGTFYLWGEAPGGDSLAYTAWLRERHVHVMPGTLFHRPGHIRISLTATRETIERALPALVEAASVPWAGTLA